MTIEEILDSISPDTVAEKIEIPNLRIRENYGVGAVFPLDTSEFKKEIICYFQYHQQQRLRSGSLVFDSDTAFAHVVRLLNRKYPGGYQTAALNSVNNRNGGFIAEVNALVDGLIEEAIEQYIGLTQKKQIDHLDYEEVMTFSKKYMEKYADVFLGKEHMSVYLLAAKINQEGIMGFHPEWVKKQMTKTRWNYPFPPT